MNKEFLEKSPLYKKFHNPGFFQWTELRNLPKPAVHMHCIQCDSEQTFNMSNEYYEVDYTLIEKSVGKVFRLRYVCSACTTQLRLFFVYVGKEEVTRKNDQGQDESSEEIYVMKAGQIPSWDIELDKELEFMLGDHAQAYRRGLISESQGYGIGAYAYFRRVAEDVIDELLESILDLVPSEEKEKYKGKLEQVKREKNAENKINLVKDLLPQSLNVDGMNPLKELYKVLSEGIHDKTDEECLDKAEAIRGILIFLVNQTVRTKREKSSFTEGMKKLLQGK
ncbi:MAG: hypothetical protein UU67_C0078G0005 [Candidatus Daviesbacteria bacterium GW2011_GWB1_41_5]|uniref:DUF4145 domain-containing protein n=1 Tax=Candidatus Daviesbacteria bacterium GW2011_GWB1_41_5 TaxID=1618429 RepID=A0A0G0YNU3_9BACT|nr:MAG: hypothetical protein UU67_C0078G0005 [Candidatus Daviesbacteria bacterium GW2011_GWB1_41_5]